MTPHQGTGNLAEAGFCEILARLSRGRETGVLHLSGPAAGKSVYLQQGSVVFASSQDPDDRLGEMLLTRGVISREQWEQAYFPLFEGDDSGGTFYVKVRGTPDQAFRSIRTIVHNADPTLPITSFRTLEEQVDRSLNTERILATLSGAFGTLGVGGGFALGAKLVFPDRDVWIIYGDGSAAYSLMEQPDHTFPH